MLSSVYIIYSTSTCKFKLYVNRSHSALACFSTEFHHIFGYGSPCQNSTSGEVFIRCQRRRSPFGRLNAINGYYANNGGEVEFKSSKVQHGYVQCSAAATRTIRRVLQNEFGHNNLGKSFYRQGSSHHEALDPLG